jgi:hypothetical protein
VSVVDILADMYLLNLKKKGTSILIFFFRVFFKYAEESEFVIFD